MVIFKGENRLACYIYPMPKGTEYTELDLKNPSKVVELFEYCGILEGLITKEGWKFLINLYGYEKLYEMNRQTDWHEFENVEDYVNWVLNEIDILPKC